MGGTRARGLDLHANIYKTIARAREELVAEVEETSSSASGIINDCRRCCAHNAARHNAFHARKLHRNSTRNNKIPCNVNVAGK